MRILATATLIILMGLQGQAESQENNPILTNPADCSKHLPWGQPTVPGNIQQICKFGYTSFFDKSALVPRLVVYRETAQDTYGCLDRLKNFHTERTLSDNHRPSPNDYEKTGYDLGHNAPDQDMATSYVRLFDSYNMVNVSPQLPKLNRQGWEWLEEKVRSWATERGEIVVFVGSILSNDPKTIGINKIAIPDAFYKVIVDPKTDESIAFIMPQGDIPKNDAALASYETTIAEVERQTGIHLALPSMTDRDVKSEIWTSDTSKWRKIHKETCSNNGTR